MEGILDEASNGVSLVSQGVVGNNKASSNVHFTGDCGGSVAISPPPWADLSPFLTYVFFFFFGFLLYAFLSCRGSLVCLHMRNPHSAWVALVHVVELVGPPACCVYENPNLLK